MRELPILFDFKKVVPGRGFYAGVDLPGAALVREEPDGSSWACGVHPSGVSAPGDSLRHAVAELKVEIGLALEDIASEATTFEAFQAEVLALYEQKSKTLTTRFNEAKERVRRGLTENCEDLPVKANPQFSARVELLSRAEPMLSDHELAKAS